MKGEKDAIVRAISAAVSPNNLLPRRYSIMREETEQYGQRTKAGLTGSENPNPCMSQQEVKWRVIVGYNAVPRCLQHIGDVLRYDLARKYLVEPEAFLPEVAQHEKAAGHYQNKRQDAGPDVFTIAMRVHLLPCHTSLDCEMVSG
jgi:hypothetical protein